MIRSHLTLEALRSPGQSSSAFSLANALPQGARRRCGAFLKRVRKQLAARLQAICNGQAIPPGQCELRLT
jgi:hypothetical protein